MLGTSFLNTLCSPFRNPGRAVVDDNKTKEMDNERQAQDRYYCVLLRPVKRKVAVQITHPLYHSTEGDLQN